MNKRKKILITGTGGFVFSNFIRQAFFKKEPFTFVSMDKITKPYAIHNMYIHKDHNFYPGGDIADPHFVNVVFEKERPDIVIHGAAETSVDDSVKNTEKFVKSNILGTQTIIDACIKWDIERLIYVSTDEVYGPLDSEGSESFTEASPINPKNPYASSKASAELLVKSAYETHGLQYNITRSCNNYGPWQDSEKFIPKIIKSIVEETKMPLYGQGLQMRDWMHVFDHCSGIMKIIKEAKPNEIYNISAKQELSIIEVFQRICNSLEKGHDLIEFVENKPGHGFRYSSDSSKIRDLGWENEFRFNDGILETSKWYLNNKWFFRL